MSRPDSGKTIGQQAQHTGQLKLQVQVWLHTKASSSAYHRSQEVSGAFKAGVAARMAKEHLSKKQKRIGAVGGQAETVREAVKPDADSRQGFNVSSCH